MWCFSTMPHTWVMHPLCLQYNSHNPSPISIIPIWYVVSIMFMNLTSMTNRNRNTKKTILVRALLQQKVFFPGDNSRMGEVRACWAFVSQSHNQHCMAELSTGAQRYPGPRCSVCLEKIFDATGLRLALKSHPAVQSQAQLDIVKTIRAAAAFEVTYLGLYDTADSCVISIVAFAVPFWGCFLYTASSWAAEISMESFRNEVCELFSDKLKVSLKDNIHWMNRSCLPRIVTQ